MNAATFGQCLVLSHCQTVLTMFLEMPLRLTPNQNILEKLHQILPQAHHSKKGASHLFFLDVFLEILDSNHYICKEVSH